MRVESPCRGSHLRHAHDRVDSLTFAEIAIEPATVCYHPHNLYADAGPEQEPQLRLPSAAASRKIAHLRSTLAEAARAGACCIKHEKNDSGARQVRLAPLRQMGPGIDYNVMS